METEKGENWFVMVVDCELNSLENLLSSIWSLATTHNLKIPHFRFCSRYNRIITFCFRGYLERFQPNQQEIKLEIIKMLEELKNPENQMEFYFDGPRFDEFQKWITKDEIIGRWNLKRCEALYHLSKYVIYLMENGLFMDEGEMNREHSIHVLVNMMFLQETSRRYVNVLQ